MPTTGEIAALLERSLSEELGRKVMEVARLEEYVRRLRLERDRAVWYAEQVHAAAAGRGVEVSLD